MKVQLTAPLAIMPGITAAIGSVVQVSDADGAALIAAGHTEVDKDTPLRKNPALYGLGCAPKIPDEEEEPTVFTRLLPRMPKKE